MLGSDDDVASEDFLTAVLVVLSLDHEIVDHVLEDLVDLLELELAFALVRTPVAVGVPPAVDALFAES